MKKIGLLAYNFPFKKSANVGDYVQSLAALGCFGRDICDVELINREELHKYNGPVVTMMMNGWFMHRPENWPPSKSIDPIFLAFHINPSVYAQFGRPESIAYLKANQPIGCRDNSTLKFCRSNGIDAFYSGCLTLTLDRSRYTQETDRSGVLFVDVLHGKGSLRSLFRREDIDGIAKTLRIPKYLITKFFSIDSLSVENKIAAATNSLNRTDLTTQISTASSETERFNLASRFLRHYANAEVVVTSRIHVALPCLAFETPVLFVNPEIDESRFDGIAELFTTVSADELEAMSTSEVAELINKLRNPSDYIVIRESLKERVAEALRKRDT